MCGPVDAVFELFTVQLIVQIMLYNDNIINETKILISCLAVSLKLLRSKSDLVLLTIYVLIIILSQA